MILVLVGPTGSGKSKMAISLAKKLNAVIINGDAFQVYKDLNIATAKPSEEEMMEVPHYLFDFIPLDEAYNVAEYQEDLRAELAELEKTKTNVIIAGGTGLYIRAGLYDYSFPTIKEADMTPYEGLNDEELHEVLTKLDPLSAEKIHPHNRIRVKRAISLALSGERKSETIAKQSHNPLYPCFFYGIERERQSLYDYVEKRVDEMFENGIEEENKRLVDLYGREAHAFKAIGVKEFFPYWDKECSLDEVKENIKKNTRHYVKRQMTFFRNQFDVTWISSEEELLSDLLKRASFE